MPPSWVAEYIGIPFVSGGRDHTGCDCYGLVRLVLMERFGYTLPLLDAGYTDARRLAETAPLFDAQLPLLAGEQIDRPEPGSVAVLLYQGRTSHVGVFVDDEYILHTLAIVGVHCVRLNHGTLRGAIEGIYRVSQNYRCTPSFP